MTGLVVYASSDPAVLAAYQDAVTTVAAYMRRLLDVLSRHGLGDREVVFTDGPRPGRLAGIKPAGCSCGCVPAGWRPAPVTGLGLPDGRTRAGLAVKREIDALRYPGGFRDGLPGMPVVRIVSRGPGGHPRTVTCEFSRHDGTVYAAWEPPGPGDLAGTGLWAPGVLPALETAPAGAEAAR